MSQPPARTRPYDATRRRAAAEQRRQRVADVAARMFVEHGWSRTRLADVAQAAEVSTELVAKAFGSKQGLLMAAFRLGAFGEHRTLQAALAALDLPGEPDPEARLDKVVEFTAHSVESLAPMIAVMDVAADQDPDLRRLLLAAREGHVGSCGDIVAAFGGDPTDRELVDEVALLTRGETYLMLVCERGWERERYTDWLRRRLSALLLSGIDRG